MAGDREGESRVATAGDAPRVAEVLTHAFGDDPVWRWLVVDDDRWRRGGPHIFAQATHKPLAEGTVWVAGDIGSAAVWRPPGSPTGPSIRDLLALPRLASILRGRSLTGLRYETAMAKARPTEPHWYLALLGTHPDQQGRGLASSALRPVLDRCDHDGTGAYLESSKEANIPFYRRHGFEVVEELRPNAVAPALWSMWRDPQPPER